MQLKRLISALEKNGITVEKKARWSPGNFKFYATKNGKILSFYENGKDSGNVTHLTYEHPDTNSSYDLFMDSYFSTIKSAVNYFNG